MSTSNFVLATERFIVRRGSMFAEMSVDIFEPEAPRGTVFCLHDYLGNSRDFRHFGGFLAAHNYRVVCPDMFGRGDSAYLNDPAHYRSGTHLFSLMSILQHFHDQRVCLLGKGWGGLLALILKVRTSYEPERLVIADMPVLGSIELPTSLEHEFGSFEQAQTHLLESEELVGTSEWVAKAIAEGRIRQTEAGRFALRFDTQLMTRAGQFRGRAVNAARLVASIGTPQLHLAADRLPQETRKTLQAVLNPHSAIADGVMPDARLHFSSAHEQLLVLGFLESRTLAQTE